MEKTKIEANDWYSSLSTSTTNATLAKQAIDILIACGQEALLNTLLTEQNGNPDNYSLDNLFKQLIQVNTQYPGGLVAYVTKARILLRNAKDGLNPFLKYEPKVPTGVKIDYGSDDFLNFEELGSREISKVCFVLVAGGLGERLGYSGIKVALPVELSSCVVYLNLYFEHILSLQLQINEVTAASEAQVLVPVVIMTSDDTHESTMALLELNNYFGLSSIQVTVLKQDKVASLGNIQADMILDNNESTDPRLSLKPHGHGDVHLLLHQSGIARKWAEIGKKWVCFFQDTNAMAFRTLLPGLGVSETLGLKVNFMTVPRKAKADAGAIMKLDLPNSNESLTLNVEYNYVEDVLKHNGFVDGDTNGPDGYSPFPGNTNQLIFALPDYADQLDKTGGLVPEFVNPKYVDDERTTFSKPTRLECMMQDYPQALDGSVQVGVTIFNDYVEYPALTHRLYCPVKNNIVVARSKAEQGIPSASAITGECTVYSANATMLRVLGAQIGEPQQATLGGIQETLWPKIVLLPRFCPSFGCLVSRFGGDMSKVVISPHSTLVLEGDISFPNGLKLDGSLCIRLSQGKKLIVDRVDIADGANGYCKFAELDGDEDVPEYIQIRGCQLIGAKRIHAITDDDLSSSTEDHIVLVSKDGK